MASIGPHTAYLLPITYTTTDTRVTTQLTPWYAPQHGIADTQIYIIHLLLATGS